MGWKAKIMSILKKIFSSIKTKTQEHIRQNVGILVDVPNQGGDDTNNGNVARTFFNPKFRNTICSLITDEVDCTKLQHTSEITIEINVMLPVNLASLSCHIFAQLSSKTADHGAYQSIITFHVFP